MKSTICLALLGCAAATTAAAQPLVFEKIFSPTGEPAALHYRAAFKAQGTDHQLEVWRDGDRRVKRVTDQVLVSYGVRTPGDPNFQLQLLDLRKRISTHIDRTTMYRLGNFIDWFDLTHGLRQPKGSYRLERSTAPAGAVGPIGPCDWYTLTQAGRATRLCWSRSERLPLLIVGEDGSLAWRITALDRNAPAAGVFTVADKGFVRVDAVRDADRD